MCSWVKVGVHSRGRSKGTRTVGERETPEGETRVWLLGGVEFCVVKALGSKSIATLLQNGGLYVDGESSFRHVNTARFDMGYESGIKPHTT